MRRTAGMGESRCRHTVPERGPSGHLHLFPASAAVPPKPMASCGRTRAGRGISARGARRGQREVRGLERLKQVPKTLNNAR